MSELISKDAALGCFTDWIDRYGHEHTADEDPVYQRIEALDAVRRCDEDCISRRVAIEAIDDIESEVADGFGFQYEKWREYFCELPAVQPDHNADVSKKVEGDCISRRAAIDAVSEYATIWMSYTDGMSASDIAQEAINSAKDTMIRILKNQPTVQPETATVTIGRTKGSVTMWYECDACGEPIDQKDCYCRNCGRKLTLPEPYRGGDAE